MDTDNVKLLRWSCKPQVLSNVPLPYKLCCWRRKIDSDPWHYSELCRVTPELCWSLPQALLDSSTWPRAGLRAILRALQMGSLVGIHGGIQFMVAGGGGGDYSHQHRQGGGTSREPEWCNLRRPGPVTYFLYPGSTPKGSTASSKVLPAEEQVFET